MLPWFLPRWVGVWLLPGLAQLGLAGLVAWTHAAAPTPTIESLAVPTSESTEFVLPTAPATWDRRAYNTMVAEIMTVLPTASPHPDLPPGKKQAIEQRQDAFVRAAKTVEAQYPVPVEPFPTRTPGLRPKVIFPTQVAGAGVIVPLGCGMEYKEWVRSSNRWSEVVNDTVVAVCAGASPDNSPPHQGAIMVLTTDLSDAIIGGPDTYNTPTQAGSVHVIDAVGERLTLKAADGTLFYFAVSTRQWVNP